MEGPIEVYRNLKQYRKQLIRMARKGFVPCQVYIDQGPPGIFETLLGKVESIEIRVAYIAIEKRT